LLPTLREGCQGRRQGGPTQQGLPQPTRINDNTDGSKNTTGCDFRTTVDYANRIENSEGGENATDCDLRATAVDVDGVQNTSGCDLHTAVDSDADSVQNATDSDLHTTVVADRIDNTDGSKNGTDSDFTTTVDYATSEHGCFMQANPQTSGQDLDPHQYTDLGEPILRTAPV
jgi:hypothetical protein